MRPPSRTPVRGSPRVQRRSSISRGALDFNSGQTGSRGIGHTRDTFQNQGMGRGLGSAAWMRDRVDKVLGQLFFFFCLVIRGRIPGGHPAGANRRLTRGSWPASHRPSRAPGQGQRPRHRGSWVVGLRCTTTNQAGLLPPGRFSVWSSASSRPGPRPPTPEPARHPGREGSWFGHRTWSRRLDLAFPDIFSPVRRDLGSQGPAVPTIRRSA